MRWHVLPAEAALAALRTSPGGLAADEAARRLGEHGANVLAEARRRTPFRMVLDQFADFAILLLLAAAAVSALIGDATDAVVIGAIVALNAAVGVAQEHRAERAMAALRGLTAPTATVLRDGLPGVVPAVRLVPGDVVLLEAGAVVPADVRLLEAPHLEIEEAALTGESVPVVKQPAALADETLTLGDRTNIAYKGTVVTRGRGRGVVVATGMATELGRIAGLLSATEAVRTPLQRRLARLGQRVAVAVLAICAVVFGVGVVRGEPPLLMFLTAVSLAVAAIPEALPAVVTVALALGARRMAERQALVRRLPAVEALGSVTYVCADKTGTLTQNRLRVDAYFCDGAAAPAPGSGPPWDALLRALALCNDAAVGPSGAVIGDPTDTALLVAAREAGANRAEAERAYPRLAELPFDAGRKRSTTIHRDPTGGVVSFTKGAAEVIVKQSVAVLTGTGPAPLDRARLVAEAERMAECGLRVLAVATRAWPAPPGDLAPDHVERDLMLLGLVGMIDPPRPEAHAAVQTCRAAGIVPVMVTGDHPLTAAAIARRLGILEAGHGAATMTGAELAALPPGELASRVATTRVYARVAPEQKLAIVTALQARGELVAMTGDGVNDAPALRRADIGVAMGVSGTDVAKEAAAMVLLDDDFATIVGAVREGRTIYDNVRKFVRYVLTTNAAEVWTIFLAPFLGLPIPLLPAQILWINLVSDGLPGLALAAEPAEEDVMRRPPRPPGESVFAHGLGVHVAWVGLLMAALTLGTQAWLLHAAPERWRTVVFTVLCVCQLAHVLAIRSERTSLAVQGLGSNRSLLGAVALTLALQLAVIYWPPAQAILGTTPLAPSDLALAVGCAAVVLGAVEIEKWVRWRRGAAPDG